MARTTVCLTALVICVGFGAQPAHAIPILQLYAEGATYNPVTETWVLAPGGSSEGEPFRLWTIGNIAGPGGKGAIADVRLCISYDEAFKDDLQITLTPALAGGTGSYNGFTDSNVPGLPDQNGLIPENPIQTSNGPFYGPVVDDGSAPMLSDGRRLPRHGSFGDGIVWQEFSLGDFDDPQDSLIGDFIDEFPAELHEGGQVNAYDVSVLSGGGTVLHFDLYNHVGAKNRARFAPFSHDAEIIPEASSVVVWSLLGLVFAGAGWRRRRKRAD